MKNNHSSHFWQISKKKEKTANYQQTTPLNDTYNLIIHSLSKIERQLSSFKWMTFEATANWIDSKLNTDTINNRLLFILIAMLMNGFNDENLLKFDFLNNYSNQDSLDFCVNVPIVRFAMENFFRLDTLATIWCLYSYKLLLIRILWCI